MSSLFAGMHRGVCQQKLRECPCGPRASPGSFRSRTDAIWEALRMVLWPPGNCTEMFHGQQVERVDGMSRRSRPADLLLGACAEAPKRLNTLHMHINACRWLSMTLGLGVEQDTGGGNGPPCLDARTGFVSRLSTMLPRVSQLQVQCLLPGCPIACLAVTLQHACLTSTLRIHAMVDGISPPEICS